MNDRRVRDATHPRLSRPTLRLLMTLYCFALLVAFDLAYSHLLYEPDHDTAARVAHPRYHHGFAPNYRGYERWGHLRYQLFTNNLGFKDAHVRTVPPTPDAYRILLIGGSFTEAIGSSFEDSFAGLLYRAGQRSVPPIEFLNAGVSGYSPVIYLEKIKYLLGAGLRVDEVVVLLNAGDVVREATSFFCLDEEPTYRAHCGAPRTEEQPVPVQSGPRRPTLGRTLEKRLVVITSTWKRLQQQLREWRRRWTRNPSVLPDVLARSVATGWTIPTVGAGLQLRPLGLEGGIARARRNMQELADHLHERGVALTVGVHPWPVQLAYDDRESRELRIWREFCRENCRAFIDLYPAFFAFKTAQPDWYEQLFIYGDVHYSAKGNELMFRELARHLLQRPERRRLAS